MITSRRVSTLMPPLWATTFYVVFLKIREFLSQEPTPLTTGELASPRSLPRPSASALEGRHDSYTPPCMKDDQSAHISCKSSCRAHRYQKTAEPNYVSSALAATGRIRYLLRRQLATRGLRERQTLLLGRLGNQLLISDFLVQIRGTVEIVPSHLRGCQLLSILRAHVLQSEMVVIYFFQHAFLEH